MIKWTALLAAGVALSSVAQAAEPRGLPIGACLNIGNTLEAMSEGSWGGGKVEAADFQRIRAAGFDTVRIPVRWHNKSQDKPPYTVDAAWMARVVSVVDMALAADLKVILNSHHFDPIHKDPLGVQPWHTAVWSQIAPRFKDYPTHRLWFELENEPHDKFDDSNLRAVLDPALAVVRQTNPDRPVIYGGQNWSGIDSLATLTLPDDRHVYPTFHYYDPFEFTHQGAQWAAPNVPPPGRRYGTPADAAALERDVARVMAYAARSGAMPFMGESGAFDRHASLAERVAYTKAVHDAFVPGGVPVCQWAYANTFPFHDRAAGKWLPGLRGALGLSEDDVPTATARVSGSPFFAQATIVTAPDADPLAELRRQLPGTLINDPSRIDWSYNGAVKVQVVQDPAIVGGAARRYSIATKPANAWDAQTMVPLTATIAKGQTVTIGFYARTISSKAADGKGILNVRFNQNAAPYFGFGDATVSIGSEWQWYEVTGVAPQAIARAEATVAMQMGGAAQVIEIGQAIVIEGAAAIQQKAPAAAPVAEAELPPQLQGQGVLINRPGERNWSNNGTGDSWQDRDEPAIWLGKATRFTTTAVGANPWDLGTSIPITEAIQEGDKLLIAVAARTQSAAAADGKASVGVRIQGNTPPYEGFAQNTLSIGPNWQLIRLRTTATQAFPAGSASLALHFAGAVQAVDIGPVYVIKTP